MNKPNLSEIYRNVAPMRSDIPSDVDQIIAEIPRSPMQRDLIRFARDLEPESAALSANLESVLNGGRAVHRRGFAQRSAHGRRRWRIASALAASLIAAVAVWSTARLDRSHVSSHATAAPANDRIFSSINETSVATKSASGDVIFNGDFRSDEIFNASRHNDG